MNSLRQFGTAIAGMVMTFSILALTFFAGLYGIMTSPKPIENALSESGIYNQIEQDFITQKESSLPSELADNASVRQLLEQSVSAGFLQQSSHDILTNMYAWMQGASASLDLTVNISGVKDNFANSLTAYVQKKFQTLPQCTTFVEPPQSLEAVMNLTCRPVGVDDASIATTVHQGVLDSNLLGVDNTIGIDQAINNQRQTIMQQLAIIPMLYRYYMLSLYVLPILIVLCAIGLVFWSLTRRRGLKRVAWICISAGVTSSVVAFGCAWAFGIVRQFLGSDSVQGSIVAILEALAGDVRGWWLATGIGFIVIGIIVFAVLYFTRTKNPTPYERPEAQVDTTQKESAASGERRQSDS